MTPLFWTLYKMLIFSFFFSLSYIKKMDTSSFISDVTFSKPIELDLAFLGKYQSSFLSDKSPTVQSPIETRSHSNNESPTKEEGPKRFKRVLKATRNLLVKYWFLLGLLIAILLAWRFPDVARKGGYLRAEWSIKWGNTETKQRIIITLTIYNYRCCHHHFLYFRNIVTHKNIGPDFYQSSLTFINTNNQSCLDPFLYIWSCLVLF